MRVHRPAFSSDVWNAIRLAAANISATMCSPTMGAIRPGWLLTTIPSSDAASRSIMSVPIEHVEIIRRSGSDSRAGRNHLTAPLVLMMTSAFSTRRSCSSIEAGRSL